MKRKQIASFRQFSSARRFLLRFGFDTKTTPFDPLELCLLAELLEIEARDLDVASGGRDEKAIVHSAENMRVANKAKLQSRVREELSHRRQSLNALVAIVSVCVAIVAAISSYFSAQSSSQSAATAQAAVNVIIEKQ